MSDLISRQDTIDRINEYIEEYSEIDSDGNHSEKWCAMQEAKMTIENMPSAQPEQRWIPCSERLPDEGYSVLVTRIIDDNCKYVRIASYQGDCWMDNTDEFNKPNPHKVIAWQPFSKPYEPQESEDKCKNCEYYHNPDYTRCHECKAESEAKE